MARRLSPRSRFVALILCWTLGLFGAHRYYVGKIGTGLLMLVTLGGCGIWYLVDLVMVLIGKFADKEGRVLYRWFEPGSV